MITKITTHTTDAIARLPQQHQDKTNLVAFLSALTTQAQNLEDAQWDLFTKRFVDTAEGVQLDAIGSLVGQRRDGAADDDYRRFIRARISVNKSNGLIEDILTVTRSILNLGPGDGTLTINNSGIAALTLTITSVVVSLELATFLAKFLQDTVAAGVRLISITMPYASAEMFQLEGGDNTGLGLGDTGNPLTGGHLANAYGT